MRLLKITVKQSKLITNYAKVARKVTDNELEFDEPEPEWDFIIVGGGTAGCVLASRLSEDPHLRVLLIEAGGSSKNVIFSRVPAAFSQLFHTRWDYDLYTEPQLYAGNKKKYWPRAKLLGGCSAMNAMVAQYGAPSDFDEWAKITGDESWSWNNFSKYIRKFEKYAPDPRFPQVDPAMRGADGPVEVGYHAHIWPGCKAFVEASMGIDIPFSPDFCTTKGTIGVNKTVTYIDSKSTRVTTESAYLTDEVLARPNLKVVTYARVTKVLFDTSTGVPRATGVEFARKSRCKGKVGPKFRARAIREIIVSGGAVHSPQILMLSGIGPATQLSCHGIPVVLDAPGVGANLIDHPSFSLRLQEKTRTTFNHLKPHNPCTMGLFVRDLLRYELSGTGPIASNIAESIAFFRSDDPVLFPPAEYNHDIEDANSGADSPDLEIIMCAVAADSHNRPLSKDFHAYQMLVILLRPTSKGSLLLKSADPWDDPLLDPNYLETKHDIDVLVRGVRTAFKVAHTAPMTSITDVESTHPRLDHNFSSLSDAELADIVRDRVETNYHPTGTCSMGPGGVVDSDLRVKGTQGLRVCDASVFPTLVSGHPTGAVIATAEKLADMLKVHYGTK